MPCCLAAWRYILWNPSITDTVEEQHFVRYSQLRGFRYISGRRGMRSSRCWVQRSCVFRAFLCCTLAEKAKQRLILQVTNVKLLTTAAIVDNPGEKGPLSRGRWVLLAYHSDRENCRYNYTSSLSSPGQLHVVTSHSCVLRARIEAVSSKVSSPTLAQDENWFLCTSAVFLYWCGVPSVVKRSSVTAR